MSNFVICIDNSGNEASLIVGKVYSTACAAIRHQVQP
jgi:hypothetical protein